MRKKLIYGDPVSSVIMIDSIDAVFINNEDKKILIYWLRGGQTFSITFPNEEMCQKELESVIKEMSME